MKKSNLIKVTTTAGAVLAACSILAGCGGGNSGSEEKKTGNAEATILLQGHTQSTFTTDPAIAYQGANSVNMGTCETLFTLDNSTRQVVPNLAKGIEKVDANTWKVTIKDGIKFTNGKDLTGEACKTALEYTFAKNTSLTGIVKVASIEARGQTVTIKTEKPSAILPRILTSTDALIFDTSASDYMRGLIGTGPYILEKMDAEGNCELVRNDKYWKGKPGLAKLHTKTGLDAKAVTRALQSGEIDWASVPSTDLKLFEGNSGFNVIKKNAGRVYFLYVNPNFTSTKDPAVRGAVQHAFNREDIVSGVYSNQGAVTTSIFTSDSRFYQEQTKDVKYNPDQAKKILADAGYKDTNGDGFVDKDGQNIKFNIVTYKANSFPKLCEVLKEELKVIGIDSEIKVSEQVMDELKKSEFNIATYGYNTETFGDCQNYLQPVYQTGKPSNFIKFSSQALDRYVEQLETESDEAKRAELGKNIQKEIYKETDHIYLMHVVNSLVSKKDVKGLDYGMYGLDPAALWKITK